MKKLLGIVLALCMVLALTPAAFAAGIVASGYCGGEGDGTNLSWTLDSAGTLTISGKGKMASYKGVDINPPWERSCIKKIVFGSGVLTIGDEAFVGSPLTSITIPDGITAIGEGAFAASYLKTVRIPKSVASIGYEAFVSGHDNSAGNGGRYDDDRIYTLTDIYVDAGNTAYCSIDGVLFSKDRTKLIEYPNGNARTVYTVPNSVTYISPYSFMAAGNLKTVNIQKGVTDIGIDAFIGCKFRSIDIPDGVLRIAGASFSYCDNLETVTIGAGIKYIGAMAFYDESVVKRVYFRGDAPNVKPTTDIPSSFLPDCKIYYETGKAGWTSPTWNGYKTATWDGQSKLPFRDVAGDDWFFNSVADAYENGLMSGTEPNIFAPRASLNRAMLVTILYRSEGAPAVAGMTPFGFTDVAEGTWYHDAVTWAYNKDIVKGLSDTKFAPTTNVTREQIASILYRYAQYKHYDTSNAYELNDFSDKAKVDPWALSAMKWANAEGLIMGRANGTLDPRGTAARAEAAAILTRFSTNIAS